MPKIEVNETLFFNLLEEKYSYDVLEERLTCAKAELDEIPNESTPENERSIKIELNDTNRPDLWSTAGLARQLKQHAGKTQPANYASFLSFEGKTQDYGNRIVDVDKNLADIRPYMTAFVVSGKAIDEPMLLDIIQMQEKLCHNYGRKRRSISMGIYRNDNIQWPIRYCATDPDTTSFVPLDCEEKMTCRQILSDHPKGKEYAHILQNAKQFPLLVDSKDEILSMAPIINSATLGAVKVGDSNLLVELTGTDMPSLLLATMIVACNFADTGYTVLPCLIRHPYDTGFDKELVTPFYFQKPVQTSFDAVEKLLAEKFDAEKLQNSLLRMGVESSIEDTTVTIIPPAYRNDFLHEIDIIEDIMIGCDLSSFIPEKPRDFTIGRLLPLTIFSRKVKSLMVGLGYQEMIFNYLGSKKDFIDKMNADGKNIIEISNPMSENFQYVRPSILPSLLNAEANSAHAVYPHKVFEIGKTAFLCDEEVTGTKTSQYVGFLTASSDANFNTIASEVATLLHFLDYEYIVSESNDTRFIAGRQAHISAKGEIIGIFGEVHPAVLENRAITVPCVAGEIDLEKLL